MAGASKTGTTALAWAAPWLVLGGAILLIVYIVKNELGDGGLQAWFEKLLGTGKGKKTEGDPQKTQQDAAGQDKQRGGVGSAAVTGHFAIASRDTLSLDVHFLGIWKSTVTVPFDLVNSSPDHQQVLVQIHAYQDYLFSDQQTTWEQLVPIDGYSGTHVEAVVELTNIFSTIPTTRPQLFLDLTVAGVHNDRVEHIETA